MLVNFDRVSVAPSPRSSRATLIWSAAFTKPSTSSCDVLPRRPASWASLFKSSREVRVSIFLNSWLSSSTCSAVIPVNLRTLAISASISANAFTAERPAITMPVTAAAPAARVVCQSFILRLKRSQKLSPFLSSRLTLSISALTCLMYSVCFFHASEPLSRLLSCFSSVLRVLCSSLGVALSSCFSTFSTCIVADSISRICLWVVFNSLRSLVSSVLLPALAAFAIAFSRLKARVRNSSSTFLGCSPFIVRFTDALVV